MGAGTARAGQLEAAHATDARKPHLDGRSGVLGHVEHDMAWIGDVEDVEARRGSGNGDGQIEGEPRFAGLGGIAETPTAARAHKMSMSQRGRMSPLSRSAARTTGDCLR
jgi:hypothetical protein